MGGWFEDGLIATLRLHQESFIINQSKLASNLILMVNWEKMKSTLLLVGIGIVRADFLSFLVTSKTIKLKKNTIY